VQEKRWRHRRWIEIPVKEAQGAGRINHVWQQGYQGIGLGGGIVDADCNATQGIARIRKE